MFILQGVLVPLEDALGFSQKTSIVRGVGSFEGGPAVVTWSLIHQVVGPSSSVVGPIFPHLKKVGTAAEEDVLGPSVGFP